MKEIMALDRHKAGSQTIAHILEKFQVKNEGLTTENAQQRYEQYGPNRLRQATSKSTGQIFVEQFKNAIVVMLLAAVGLSLAFGDLIEAAAITVVILVNGLIGFFTELKAVRSMEALQKLGSVEAAVLREGHLRTIPAEELVPGDIVMLDSGDVVTADLRLLEASKMQVDESALTGESVPVSKQTEPVTEDVPLAEQINMVFKGTAITRGSGKGVVVVTGMDTELGKISSLVEEAEEEVTPLEQRLETLGHRLIWLTIGIAVVVGIAGALSGKQFFLMIQTAIALAIAAIPEGLPIVATIALARGMRRMAKRNALMNKLSSVETLGATTVICMDKTGTLTENQMMVTRFVFEGEEIGVSGDVLAPDGEFLQEDAAIEPEQHSVLKTALEIGVLCNNAALPVDFFEQAKDFKKSDFIGDPMEVALLVAGAKAGISRKHLLETLPEEHEEAFDPDNKMMATYHHDGKRYRVAVKGAPEAVLEVCSQILTGEQERELCSQERQQWLERNRRMAENGLRVLALAQKTVKTADEKPYHGLSFVGFVGLLDPARQDVREAIQLCKNAGIKVIMVTGDQVITARHVGQAVGLIAANESMATTQGAEIKDPEELSQEEQQRLLHVPIFARVSPKQKLDLIALHQQHGAIVAMTGDGVNDAPALEKADIGIAMGKHGTQVAQEAADMILKDDAFSTIVEAVRYGRVIFGNIRKFVMYLLSGNAGEILIVALATLFNSPLPLLPLQILFLNFVEDVFPALALGVGVGAGQAMYHPPRNPKEPVMTRGHWYGIVGYGTVIAVAVLTAFIVALRWFGVGPERAVTISFLTLAIARLWHVFNMRDADAGVFNNDITGNPWVWGALALCTGLILSAVYVPTLADVLKISPPGLHDWAFILGMSLIPLLIGQGVKVVHIRGNLLKSL